MAYCNVMIYQQATLSGDAERLKVADAVIEADLSMAYNPALGLLSSLKPQIFNSLKNELRFLDNVGV